jgi:hypothetical protein
MLDAALNLRYVWSLVGFPLKEKPRDRGFLVSTILPGGETNLCQAGRPSPGLHLSPKTVEWNVSTAKSGYGIK